MLTKILTYHVVPATGTGTMRKNKVKDDGGKLSGKDRERRHADRQRAWSRQDRPDEKGGTATVTIADVKQSNGVIHVIDKAAARSAPLPPQVPAPTPPGSGTLGSPISFCTASGSRRYHIADRHSDQENLA